MYRVINLTIGISICDYFSYETILVYDVLVLMRRTRVTCRTSITRYFTVGFR